MKTTIAILCRALAWVPLLSCGAALAANSENLSLEIPLARLLTEDRPLRLETARGGQTLSVPVSARMEMRAATLDLDLVSSVALLKQRSQVTVHLNDRIVAQIPLDPAAPEANARIRIPAGYFQPGYNRLRLSAAQHYTERCEDPSAPELWTEVIASDSILHLEYRLRDLKDTRLSELEDIFDAKLWGAAKVRVLGAGTLDQRTLDWGALVAQGVALRLRYTPAELLWAQAAPAALPPTQDRRGWAFPFLHQDRLADADTVMVGSLDQLSPFLGKEVRGRITGAYLGIHALDLDPRRALILISGTTEEEVTRAAQAFALMSYPYPDSQWIRIDGLTLPTFAPYSGQATVHPNGEYAFSRLGLPTRTVSGIHTEALKLNVNLPGDLFASEDAVVDLHLNLSYGAGMRRDSVFNIYLNGEFETSIALDRETGGRFHNYRVAIPLRSFQPGPNSISFQPHLLPMVSGECAIIDTRNLVLTLFGDSTLMLPNAAHFAVLPDLRRFALTGFPYLIPGDGSGIYLYLPRGDGTVAGAAWTLLAKLTQRKKLPLLGARVSFDPPPEPRALLVLGTSDRLNEELVADAPIRLGSPSRADYPVAPGRREAEMSLSLPTRWYQAAREALTLHPPEPRPELAHLTHTGALGRSTLAMQYRSTFAGDHTLTLVTADDGDTLARGVARLVTPEYWSRLEGDLALWRSTLDSFAAEKLGDEYQVGEIDTFSRLGLYLSRSPWLFLALVLGVVLSLAVVTLRLLIRFRRRHRPHLSLDDE